MLSLLSASFVAAEQRESDNGIYSANESSVIITNTKAERCIADLTGTPESFKTKAIADCYPREVGADLWVESLSMIFPDAIHGILRPDEAKASAAHAIFYSYYRKLLDIISNMFGEDPYDAYFNKKHTNPWYNETAIAKYANGENLGKVGTLHTSEMITLITKIIYYSAIILLIIAIFKRPLLMFISPKKASKIAEKSLLDCIPLVIAVMLLAKSSASSLSIIYEIIIAFSLAGNYITSAITMKAAPLFATMNSEISVDTPKQIFTKGVNKGAINSELQATIEDLSNKIIWIDLAVDEALTSDTAGEIVSNAEFESSFIHNKQLDVDGLRKIEPDCVYGQPNFHFNISANPKCRAFTKVLNTSGTSYGRLGFHTGEKMSQNYGVDTFAQREAAYLNDKNRDFTRALSHEIIDAAYAKAEAKKDLICSSAKSLGSKKSYMRSWFCLKYDHNSGYWLDERHGEDYRLKMLFGNDAEKTQADLTLERYKQQYIATVSNVDTITNAAIKYYTSGGGLTPASHLASHIDDTKIVHRGFAISIIPYIKLASKMKQIEAGYERLTMQNVTTLINRVGGLVPQIDIEVFKEGHKENDLIGTGNYQLDNVFEKIQDNAQAQLATRSSATPDDTNNDLWFFEKWLQSFSNSTNGLYKVLFGADMLACANDYAACDDQTDSPFARIEFLSQSLIAMATTVKVASMLAEHTGLKPYLGNLTKIKNKAAFGMFLIGVIGLIACTFKYIYSILFLLLAAAMRIIVYGVIAPWTLLKFLSLHAKDDQPDANGALVSDDAFRMLMRVGLDPVFIMVSIIISLIFAYIAYGFGAMIISSFVASSSDGYILTTGEGFLNFALAVGATAAIQIRFVYETCKKMPNTYAHMTEWLDDPLPKQHDDNGLMMLVTGNFMTKISDVFKRKG